MSPLASSSKWIIVAIVMILLCVVAVLMIWLRDDKISSVTYSVVTNANNNITDTPNSNAKKVESNAHSLNDESPAQGDNAPSQKINVSEEWNYSTRLGKTFALQRQFIMANDIKVPVSVMSNFDSLAKSIF